MTKEELNEMLEKFTPQQLINQYCTSKIKLFSHQIDKLIKVRDTIPKRFFKEKEGNK